MILLDQDEKAGGRSYDEQGRIEKESGQDRKRIRSLGVSTEFGADWKTMQHIGNGKPSPKCVNFPNYETFPFQNAKRTNINPHQPCFTD